MIFKDVKLADIPYYNPSMAIEGCIRNYIEETNGFKF